MNLLSFLLPLLFIGFMMRRGMSAMGGKGPGNPFGGGKGGGMFGFGQSTARILKENTGVTFK
jgi:ATP-dependent Zn protease